MPGFSFPAPRDLSSIVKSALLEREVRRRPPGVLSRPQAFTPFSLPPFAQAPDQIKMIWEDFHASRSDSVARTLSKAKYEGFKERARKMPNFVYPVRKGEGQFFTLFAQWQDRHCIFTYLEDYRRNPLGAEPYFAVTFFDDLVDRKGLVLVRGDYSYHITKPDAEALLDAVEHFYLHDTRLLEDFNLHPERFSFEKLMDAMPQRAEV